jgi:hypothetical protein
MSQMLSWDAVIWAFRLLIGRDPENEQEIALHGQHSTVDALRTAFLQTPEFRRTYAMFGPRQLYQAPLFMLQGPQDDSIP